MEINVTITKKTLETLILQAFQKYGNIKTSELLDSLKFLGFSFATSAGISIGLEDFKTPLAKSQLLEDDASQQKDIESLWQKANISEGTRFQTIMSNWAQASDFLKNKITDFFKEYDPLNNLYIMAFSGARGNITQVSQLVGSRGLMVDQEGHILEVPIHSNFIEGLTSLDYLISAYGARKGIVDTALKTADSGYLTRRLIFLAKDCVIKERDCRTRRGVIRIIEDSLEAEALVGPAILQLWNDEYVVKDYSKFEAAATLSDFILGLNLTYPIFALTRSPISCESLAGVCKRCYEFMLIKNDALSLGDCVGIIAAQSIGEPGTQLTMRTFHTGGVFTGSVGQKFSAPCSGRLIYPQDLKYAFIQDTFGKKGVLLLENFDLEIRDWSGTATTLSMQKGTLFYGMGKATIIQDEILSEPYIESLEFNQKRIKSIVTPFDAICFTQNNPNPASFSININQQKMLVNDAKFWLCPGKIMRVPHSFSFQKFNGSLKNKCIFAAKIVAPFSGYINVTAANVTLLQAAKNSADFCSLAHITREFDASSKLQLFVKNWQFIEKNTVIGVFRFYSFEVPCLKDIFGYQQIDNNLLLVLPREHIWQLSKNQFENVLKYKEHANFFLKSASAFENGLYNKVGGRLIKSDKNSYFFQNALPVFLPRQTLLGKLHSKTKYVTQKDEFAYLIKEQQQAEDIVQGLPKIEELFEGRGPKIKALLSDSTGVYITKSSKGMELLNSIWQKEDSSFPDFEINLFFTILNKNEALWGPSSGKYAICGLKNLSIKQFKLFGSGLNKQNSFKSKTAFVHACDDANSATLPDSFDFIERGQATTDGQIDGQDLANVLSKSLVLNVGRRLSTRFVFSQFRLVLVNSLQAIYLQQGVAIPSIHFEILAKELTTLVNIIKGGKTPFNFGEKIEFSLIEFLEDSAKKIKADLGKFLYFPMYASSTYTALNSQSFLAAASFQEVKRVLTKAAIQGSSDWLRGLKESVALGRFIPYGTNYLTHKESLDNLILFKK